MGSAAPEKLNPNQTSVKMISSTLTGALTTATNQFGFFFLFSLRKAKKLLEVRGNLHYSYRLASIMSPKLGALPTGSE